MAILEGKTTTERNKIIAAGALGVVALFALYMAFGSAIFGGSSASSASAKSTPSPKPSPGTASRPDPVLPTAADQDFVYTTTPVMYPGSISAPDAGRNIFAFYEPPPPCPGCTPLPTPKPIEIKTPSPTPTPPFMIASLNPQNIYAGSATLRLEVNGDRFTPDARIYFNQSELPTTFLSPQKLVADVPANLIVQEGQRQIIVQTPDGKLYSDQTFFSIQPPPKPDFQYIGMIGRKRYNNDTAYFTESSKPTPWGARLNDVLSGRFRLIDIAPAEVVVEDVNLGFKHRIAISKAVAGASTGRGGSPAPAADSGFAPFDPSTQNIPGIPSNIQRYVPPPGQVQPQVQKSKDDKAVDVDDKGDE